MTVDPGRPAHRRLEAVPAPVAAPLRHGLARTNRPSAELVERPKRIVICADGTWDTPWQRAAGTKAATNVWLLYQLVRPDASDGLPQLAYYHPGVGTGGVIDRILGGAFGVGLSANIRDCYRFLVDHYAPGDAVYCFGFSRGAYTARSLVGLIRNCGIVARGRAGEQAERLIGEAYRLYRGRGDDTAPTADRAVDFRARHSHPDLRITCVGVWDTVGALGIPVGLLGRLSRLCFGFHDVTLSSWVERAFHAVAVDERRRPFTPTLWVQQLGAAESGQWLEQVWFAGSHTDVGGGYAAPERGLADGTLRWMVSRVSETCRLELDEALPDPLPPVVHDSWTTWYRIMDLGRRPPPRCIDSGLGETGARDPLGRKRETLDPSVERLRALFSERPIPDLSVPYAPRNVADYERRLATARARPSPLPPSRSDTRPI
jgi:uncharacterized protein (DUF2235 family)